jgi:hypothetical protein
MRQVKVVGRRNSHPAIVGLALQNGNQPVRLGERVRVERQRVDDCEQGRVCPNPKRQRENSRQCEARIAEQGTNNNLNTRHTIRF